MEQVYENVKSTIILLIAVLTLLFTFCLLMYTDIFEKDNMSVSESVSLPGGNDELSRSLQKIIPYQDTTDIKYVTAYQDKKVIISSVHNDVILSTALNTITEKDIYDAREFLKQINTLYGSNVFIINESFYINAKDLCIYSNETGKYTCEVNNSYKGIIYKANRSINNLSISNNNLYLLEKILFYSYETINNITYYKIYENGTFKNIVSTFTNKDIENDNITLEEYLNKFEDNEVLYESKFIITSTGYNWIETRLK